MDSTLNTLSDFAHSESGATAIEYGLLASLIAVAAIVSFGALGAGLINLFGTTDSGAGGAIRGAADSI
ncbi:MAG: Flp family type IVb pilin [Cucumibacter sp.]